VRCAPGRLIAPCVSGRRVGRELAEKTDEELAALEVGGVDVVRFAGWFYRKIARVPGLEGKVLTALDSGGFGALVELLTVYHLDEQGGYWRLDGEDKDSAG
jgi:hypothetical protein